jgi:CBS domain-containing protein
MDTTPTDIISPPQPGRKVRDVMTPKPVGVYFDQSIGETARIMRDSQVGAVFVVAEGSLCGVVTDRDLVVRGLAEGMPPDFPVGPLCSSDVVGVGADEDLGTAERLMRERAVRRLPVIGADQQVIGVLSIGDLAVSEDGGSPLADVSRAQPSS